LTDDGSCNSNWITRRRFVLRENWFIGQDGLVLLSMAAGFELVKKSRAAKLVTFLLTGSTLAGEWLQCRIQWACSVV